MDSTQNLNLEFLKKSAKSLLKQVQCGEPDVLNRLSYLKETALEKVKLADIQYVLARENGYRSWASLKSASASSNLKRALTDLKAGKAIVLFDDETRENEGDFVIAAEKVTSEHVNFITQYGRGTVCVALSTKFARQLNLISTKTDSNNDTPNFSTPLDHIETKTGISAEDRAKTIRMISKDNAEPEEFRRPGHIATLIEHKDGIKGRQGHTEGSLHIMRLAGLKPAALICEILKDDGSMARSSDLQDVAKKHGLTYISMSEFM